MSSRSPNGLSGMDPGTFTMLQQLAKAAATSKLVKGSYGNAATEAQCLMKLLYGHDLGIPASAALTGIHIYDGQMEISASLLAGLVKRHPVYDYKVKECNDRGCKLTFLRNGLPEADVEWGIEEAARAGLLTSEFYTQYPERMFFARAVSTMVNLHCRDVTHGIALYVEGEIQASSAKRTASTETPLAETASKPAEATVTDSDVEAIKDAAERAGLSDGALYNVIGVAAGGPGGVDAALGAERLDGVWARMPQRYRDRVLRAIATPALAAAAQTARPPVNASGNGVSAREPLASQGDISRIRAVAAETHVSDAALLDVIAEVAGGRTCDDPERVKELLPATFASMPLRFVQPVLTKLRPATAPAPAPREGQRAPAPAASAPSASPEEPPQAAKTVTVEFSAMQPHAAVDADDSDIAARQQAA